MDKMPGKFGREYCVIHKTYTKCGDPVLGGFHRSTRTVRYEKRKHIQRELLDYDRR